MNIPTLPAGRNKYYDLGPTRQFDVDVIRRALLQYEGTMATRVEAAQPDSDERYCLAAQHESWLQSLVRNSLSMNDARQRARIVV